jgi:hypothetical protein
MVVLELVEARPVVEIQHDQAGDGAGDQGQAATAAQHEPAVRLIDAASSLLIHPPFDCRNFGAIPLTVDRDDRPAARQTGAGSGKQHFGVTGSWQH